MKRIIAIILACSLLLSGCASSTPSTQAPSSEAPSSNQTEIEQTTNDTSEASTEAKTPEESTAASESSGESTVAPEADWDIHAPSPSKNIPVAPTYTGLNDPNLLSDFENAVYADLTAQLDPTQYRIDNVSSTYISKEYLEELAYNSQTNVFFGYSLADLDAQFQGTRYVFTLDDDGETTVVPFEAYDDTYEKVIKNVAIGTGVILVCVTVSVVSGGVGAPAVSMIFAASAKSGAIFAASSGAFSAVISGTVTGMQTGDFNEALKAGALAGSESFKWGAITGSIFGGESELVMLKTAAKGGLTLNEAAMIIQETNLPANFVRQIHSMDEYYALLEIAENGGLAIQDMAAICMTTGYPLELVELFRTTEEGVIYFEQAGLVSETINGQAALIRTIDLTYESELAGQTVTNLERMRQGYAAIDPVTGEAFQLHHIGQSVDSPLAILTQFEHTGGGNNPILHDVNIANGAGVHSLLSDAEWTLQREEFWISLAEFLVP